MQPDWYKMFIWLGTSNENALFQCSLMMLKIAVFTNNLGRISSPISINDNAMHKATLISFFTFIHGQKSMQVGRSLLIVLIRNGRLHTIAAQLKVNQVIHALLTFGNTTLKRGSFGLQMIQISKLI